MISLTMLAGKKVGVLGLGRGGMAIVENLLQSEADSVYCWDERESSRQNAVVKCVPADQWPMRQLSAVIIADGNQGPQKSEIAEKARNANVPIYSQLDLFCAALESSGQRNDVKVIAVTGAAGKSITLSLIAHILDEVGLPCSLTGDAGTALLSADAPSPRRIYLLEVSVKDLIRTKCLRSDMIIVLNSAGPRERDEVKLAVRSLIGVCQRRASGGAAIIGIDDPIGQSLCTLLRVSGTPDEGAGPIIPVSGEGAIGHGFFAFNGTVHAVDRKKAQLLGDYSRSDPLRPTYLNQNVAAAVAATRKLGVMSDMIIKALHTYGALPARCEYLGSGEGISFVDNTRASTRLAAIKSLQDHSDVYWISGSKLEADLLPSSVRKTYILAPSSPRARKTPLAKALTAACRDAGKLRNANPDLNPVIMFAPCLSEAQAEFESGEFRSLVSDYIGEVSHA